MIYLLVHVTDHLALSSLSFCSQGNVIVLLILFGTFIGYFV